MNRLLISKSIRESRWLLLGCGTAIFLFCWLRVWIVSRLSTDRFRTILEMLPRDWRRLLSVDFEWMITYPGRISLAYQELIVILCVSIWSIARGSDIVSGEINRGTMEMLLAQPISRTRILVTQSVIAVIGVALLALSAHGGTWVGIQTTSVKEEVSPKVQLPIYMPGMGTELPIPFGEKVIRHVPMREKVRVGVFWPATVNLFALGVMMTGFSTLISSCDRYRWRTIGIVTGVLVAQLILKIAGMALEGWRGLTYISLLSAYEPESHVRLADMSPPDVWSFVLYDAQGHWSGFAPLTHDLLLVGIGAISLIAAAIIFARRDLPAPV